MVATNDDLLLELQTQTQILRKIKNLIKGQYFKPEDATNSENNN